MIIFSSKRVSLALASATLLLTLEAAEPAPTNMKVQETPAITLKDFSQAVLSGLMGGFGELLVTGNLDAQFQVLTAQRYTRMAFALWLGARDVPEAVPFNTKGYLEIFWAEVETVKAFKSVDLNDPLSMTKALETFSAEEIREMPGYEFDEWLRNRNLDRVTYQKAVADFRKTRPEQKRIDEIISKNSSLRRLQEKNM
ncbi:MAG TPA: hypothetical protein VF593_02950 [Chthoniobacteraceae bacterium]